MSESSKIVVIGAGICGLSSAIWLRRAGCEVTLLDRDGPGAGASYGNAGLLAQWGIVPVNTPGLGRTALKYLANPKSPLFLQWAHLPRMIPWLLQFMANATDTRARQAAAGLSVLLGDSVEQHRALTRGTRAEKWIASSAYSYAYRNRAAFEAARYSWDLKRDFGYIPELVEGDAVREVEPMLGDTIQCLAVQQGHGHILNPGAYMADLAQVLIEEGGQYAKADVQDITLQDGRVTAVETNAGPFPCDAAVLAAGIWSKPLMQKLGLRVPLAAERGYHRHYIAPSEMPRNPLMIAEGQFAVTPMESGLRCAGTVELGHAESGPSRAPLRLIGDLTARVFPTLTYERAEEWMGRRPSTPDSLPLIGEIGGTGVHAAFGHQHVGLTGGPKTGRWVADLITGRKPNSDLAPYDANRFS